MKAIGFSLQLNSWIYQNPFHIFGIVIRSRFSSVLTDALQSQTQNSKNIKLIPVQQHVQFVKSQTKSQKD